MAASVSTTFKIIDAGSRTLDKITSAAKKTDTALEGAANAADKLGDTETQTKLKATESSVKGIGDQSKQTSAVTKVSFDEFKRTISSATRHVEGDAAKMRAALTSIEGKYTPEVEIEGVGSSLAAIRVIKQQLRSLEQQQAKASLGALGMPFAAGASAGATEGIGIFGKLTSMMSTGGAMAVSLTARFAAMAAMIVIVLGPAIVAFTGAISALIGSFAQAAIGAGILTASLSAVAMVGLGGILSVAIPTVKALIEANKAQEQYTEAVEKYGAASEQAAEKRKIFNKAITDVAGKEGEREVKKLMRLQDRVGERWAKFTQKGRAQFIGMMADGLAFVDKRIPKLSKIANQATGALRRGMGEFLDRLGSRGNMRILDRLGDVFAKVTPKLGATFGNLATFFLRVAQAASPTVLRMFDRLEKWSAGLTGASTQPGTRRTPGSGVRAPGAGALMSSPLAALPGAAGGRESTSFQKGVDQRLSQLRDWVRLFRAAARLAAAFFGAGAKQGQSLVQSMTKQLDRWRKSIEKDPTKIQNWFKDTIDDAKTLAKELGRAAKAIAQLADDLRGLIGPLSDIRQGLGAVVPGDNALVELAAGYGAYRGGKALFGRWRGGRGGRGGGGGAKPGGGGGYKAPAGFTAPGGGAGKKLPKMPGWLKGMRGKGILGAVAGTLGFNALTDSAYANPGIAQYSGSGGWGELVGDIGSRLGFGGGDDKPAAPGIQMPKMPRLQPLQQLRGGRKGGGGGKSARQIDAVGDQAAQTSRQLGALARSLRVADRVSDALGRSLGRVTRRLDNLKSQGTRNLRATFRDWGDVTSKGSRQMERRIDNMADAAIRDAKRQRVGVVREARDARTVVVSQWEKMANSVIRDNERMSSSTRTQFGNINTELRKHLRGLGIEGSALSGAMTGRSSGGTSKTVKAATGYHVPGNGNLDNVMIKAAPGESVINKHTRADIDDDLRKARKPTVTERLRHEGRPHSAPMATASKSRGHTVPMSMKFAEGGIVPVPGFPGELAATSILDEISYYTRKYGLRLTDAFGPGHQSPGHTTYGTAADLAGPDASMDAAVREMVRRGFKTLYDGRFGSMAWPGHGPSSVAGGNAHIHVEFGGTTGKMGLAGLAGMGGMEVPKMKDRKGFQGAGSARKAASQKAIDNLKKAAQQKLNKEAGGGLSGVAGGYDGPLNRVFPPGVTLSPQQVMALATKAGLPGRTFEQIAHGESNYQPGVISGDGGYGLWQMTPRVWGPAAIAKMNALGGTRQMLNPWKNALMAKYLYDQAGGISPWYGTKYVTGASKGAHVPEWGGSFGDGGEIYANRSTVIEIGEKGAETATIRKGRKSDSRAGRGRGGNGVSVHIDKIVYHGEGDIEKVVRRELAFLDEELAGGGGEDARDLHD